MSAIPGRRLGASGVTVPAIGVGTNRWGVRDTDETRVQQAYSTARDAGVGFFDSAGGTLAVVAVADV